MRTTDNFPWPKDSLSNFIKTAETNGKASIISRAEEYSRLSRLDALFEKLLSHLNHSPKLILWPFFVRAHSCVRGAARMAISGQFVETYLCLRGALENSLYAIHIDDKPSRSKAWLDRHVDEAGLKESKKNFKMNDLKATAERRLPGKVYLAVDTLYERCIDQGAHPNVHGALLNLELPGNNETSQVKGIYLHNAPSYIEGLLKDTSRVATASIHCAGSVFKERFDILDFWLELNELSRGI
jgi:hypothetical protein